MTKTRKAREYIIANPSATPAEVAEKFKMPKQYVYVLRSQMRKKGTLPGASDTQVKPETPAVETKPKVKPKTKRPVGRPSKFKTTVTVPSGILALTKSNIPVVDLVNQPPHYKTGGIETIDFIEAKGLGYHLGNVVKYISRAGIKGTNQGLEDLRKARWYLDRAIEKNEFANPTR
jgi:hypothetical protein